MNSKNNTVSNNMIEIQQSIKVAIENNNIEEFKNILLKNDISIHDINFENFDVLIFAIENRTSIEFVKYVISLQQSLNYYTLTEKHEYITPLFAAIAIKSLSIVQLLLKKGADVNFNVGGKVNVDIESFLQNGLQKSITIEIQERRILKYLLNNGFKPSLNFIDFFLYNSKYNCLLKLLFEHSFYSIYNSEFILKFLLVYKRQEPLSNCKLKTILLETNSKIQIKKNWFQNGNFLKNDIALQILSRYINCNPKLSTELIHGLYLKKDYEILKKLTPAYFNINLRNDKKQSLFDIASFDLNTEMMFYLIESGAEIDYDHLYINYIFVNKLIEADYPNITEIIDKGKYPGNNITLQMGYMLLQAIYFNNNELSKYLVEKGADIHREYYNFRKGYLNQYYYRYPLTSSYIRNEYITPLVLSILKDNETIVKYLINKGVNVNHCSKFESSSHASPINCAIKIKNKNMIKYLIEKGANINECCENAEFPIEYAIDENNMDMINFLIQDCEAKVNIVLNNKRSTPLIKAIENNHMDMMKFLIQHGADINLKSKYYSPLNYAISKNKEDMVHYLVEKGADIHDYSTWDYQTPLMNAVYHNQHKITRYLIEKGADINKSFIDSTPLLFAIHSDNEKFVKYLIKEHHVNVNGSENSSLPLMQAIYRNNKAIVKHLVEAGANINIIKNKHTPLSYAITCNAKCITRYLIEQGADLDVWPHEEPILVYAIKNNKMAIARCLVDCGVTLPPSEIKCYFKRKSSKVTEIIERIKKYNNNNNKINKGEKINNINNNKRKRMNNDENKKKNKKFKTNNKNSKKKKKKEDEDSDYEPDSDEIYYDESD